MTGPSCWYRWQFEKKEKHWMYPTNQICPSLNRPPTITNKDNYFQDTVDRNAGTQIYWTARTVTKFTGSCKINRTASKLTWQARNLWVSLRWRDKFQIDGRDSLKIAGQLQTQDQCNYHHIDRSQINFAIQSRLYLKPGMLKHKLPKVK